MLLVSLRRLEQSASTSLFQDYKRRIVLNPR
jgi:hypothetical protein